MLLPLQWLALSQRRHLIKESFLVLWLVFALAAVMWSAGYWAMSSFYWHRLLPVSGLLMQFLLSLALYPFMHRVFTLLYGALRRSG